MLSCTVHDAGERVADFRKFRNNDKGEIKSIKGMGLFETDRRDTDMESDMGFPSPAKGRGNLSWC
jgi:hypothetical protein